MRYLTFVHRSPYASWNPLHAWIRHEDAVPDEVVVAHLPDVGRHGAMVEAGIRHILEHHGGTPDVRRVEVADNRLGTWLAALRGVVDGTRSPWTIDVTSARTVPALAAAQLLRPGDEHEIVYLDVQRYRYLPKPYPWIPYNIQTLRFLRREKENPDYRRVQALRPPRGLPPMKRLAPRQVEPGRHEATVPWEALTVLFNEAAAAAPQKGADVGVEEVEIKLQELGVTVASYNLFTRRFRLHDWAEIRAGLHEARRTLRGAWRDEVPSEDFILESLASARLLPFADEERYTRILHEVAAGTQGPNPGTPLRAIALDTNLFYLEFFTAITHAAGVPMTRIPVVASNVTVSEIRHKMGWRFPPGDMPNLLRRSDVHHPHEARKAHSAHEEFEMLRTRCRMTVIAMHPGQAGGEGANDANDHAILLDFDAHQRSEHQELLVLSNDAGFVRRAARETPRLRVEEVRYADPSRDALPTAELDQVAYLAYRLALGYGRVSLKGLEVEVFGDHPADQKRFLHEDVRLRLPDKEWVRGFLHERSTRDPLRRLVAEAGVWL